MQQAQDNAAGPSGDMGSHGVTSPVLVHSSTMAATNTMDTYTNAMHGGGGYPAPSPYVMSVMWCGGAPAPVGPIGPVGSEGPVPVGPPPMHMGPPPRPLGVYPLAFRSVQANGSNLPLNDAMHCRGPCPYVRSVVCCGETPRPVGSVGVGSVCPIDPVGCGDPVGTVNPVAVGPPPMQMGPPPLPMHMRHPPPPIHMRPARPPMHMRPARPPMHMRPPPPPRHMGPPPLPLGINPHAIRSIQANGSDLPLYDMPTFRHFYNKGIECMWAAYGVPVTPQQPPDYSLRDLAQDMQHISLHDRPVMSHIKQNHKNKPSEKPPVNAKGNGNGQRPTAGPRFKRGRNNSNNSNNHHDGGQNSSHNKHSSNLGGNRPNNRRNSHNDGRNNGPHMGYNSGAWQGEVVLNQQPMQYIPNPPPNYPIQYYPIQTDPAILGVISSMGYVGYEEPIEYGMQPTYYPPQPPQYAAQTQHYPSQTPNYPPQRAYYPPQPAHYPAPAQLPHPPFHPPPASH